MDNTTARVFALRSRVTGLINPTLFFASRAVDLHSDQVLSPR
jgi:hypothetical protein